MSQTKITVTPLELPGVLLIEPVLYRDTRGFFVETYNAEIAAVLPAAVSFVTEGVSFSREGVIRGLHFQKDTHPQAKLVRCAGGAVLDVIADVRRDSPTYGKHISVELTADSQAMIYIPHGYAHGFMAHTDSVVHYKLEMVSPEAAHGVMYNDPVLGIVWPISQPILSERDRNWPPLTPHED